MSLAEREDMKKIIILLLTSILLCGCADEPIKAECDLLTIRPYSTNVEKGVFTRKEKRIDYIEYTYEYNGKLYLDTIAVGEIRLGDKTIVLIEDDGYIYDNLQLSLEDYKELHNLND